MVGSITYASVAVTLGILAILFLVTVLQHSVDEPSLIQTPSIPFENAVISSIASTRIKASVDEVFMIVAKFQNTSDTSPVSNFEWNDKSSDGAPCVGSTGSFKLAIDGFPVRTVPTKLTLFDPENKRLAYLSIRYPPWLLRSERVVDILPVKGHPHLCDYRTFQTLEGIAAYYLMLAARGELAETEKRLAEDLKAFIENSHQQPSYSGDSTC